jgi:hypothetical protein
MTEQDVRELIEEKVKELGGVRAAAREWDVSPAFVSELLRGGPLGARIPHALGIIRVVSYERV